MTINTTSSGRQAVPRRAGFLRVRRRQERRGRSSTTRCADTYLHRAYGLGQPHRAWSQADSDLTGIAGPVGTAQARHPGRKRGAQAELRRGGQQHRVHHACDLTVNLGIVNLLPLPALDGGTACVPHHRRRSSAGRFRQSTNAGCTPRRLCAAYLPGASPSTFQRHHARGCNQAG